MAIKAIHSDTKKTKKKRNVSKAKKTARDERKKAVPIKQKIMSATGNKGKKLGEMDYTFLVITIVLTVIGLIMLLSASTPAGNTKFGKSYYFFIKQLKYCVPGIAAMYIASLVDYRIYKKYANIGILAGIFLLILVLIPSIGVERNGSRRWIDLGFIDFQPSELVKFLTALFFAAVIDGKRYNIGKFDGLLKCGIWIVAIVLPILFETHLSGAIVICGIAICILIVGGANMKYILLGIFGIIGGGIGLAFAMPSRAARLTIFFNPFADPQGKGYQVIQSLYAIGSGGLFGRGLGQSMQKYSYLPEPYNDFIFSVVGEELGFVGALFIILLFVGLIIRGMKIALDAPDTFGMLLVTGIISQIAIQTLLNIAVVSASFPNTGVTLPFFSFGGTAVAMLMAELGVVLNVSRNARNKI